MKTKSFNRVLHPMEEGFSDSFEVKLNLNNFNDFYPMMKWAWRSVYDRLRDDLFEVDQELQYRNNILAMKELARDYGDGAWGVPFSAFLPDMDVDSISLQNPSRNLIDTVDLMASIQEWMAEYNKDNGASKYSFVGCAKISDNVVDTADRIRKELGLGTNWFDDFKSSAEAYRSLRNSIMNLGVLVMMNGVVGNNTHRTLNVEEFRAFTLVDPYAPLIFINSRDNENGKLFSLLHELVHIWIGIDNFYNDTYGISSKVSKEEQFCNAVAAEILVPDTLFSEEWVKQSGNSENRINELGKRFVCSRFVLLRKALETGKIDQNEFGRLLNLFQKRYKAAQDQKQDKSSSGGDFYRTLSTKWDRRFIQALYASAQSGRTPYRDVYRMTNTTGKTLEEIRQMFTEKFGSIYVRE